MFLTPSELKELTGHRRCDAQVRALRAMGIPYVVRPDGTAAVLCRYVEGLLGAESDTVEKPQEPDWTSLNAATQKR